MNRCTPFQHLKCVYITGKEVFKDGRAGKSTRHWWRMSYIGRACVDQYGTVAGNIYEGLFAIPHYSAMAVGNIVGLLAYAVDQLKGN
ncbi:hypothetical protein [Maribacter sp. 2210JD10-5]|uniref:hypothetical protein n=1 Tax=Maribacter sp. 2210JD10-5 TaxID=3386272 RepID=UPI0039BC330A